jgi:hypothetical protein
MLLRETIGDSQKENMRQEKGERLIEVTNNGQTSHISEVELNALKERQDIRIHESDSSGKKVTILNKLKG